MSQALNNISPLRFDFGKAPVENQRQRPAPIQTVVHLAKAVFCKIKKHFCNATHWKAQDCRIARVWQKKSGFIKRVWQKKSAFACACFPLQVQYRSEVYENIVKGYAPPAACTEPQRVTAVAQGNRNARCEIGKQEINARAGIRIAEAGAYSSLSREFLKASALLTVRELMKSNSVTSESLQT